ncbi:hypothetical protein [Natrialba magadii]|uniref:hypothetical protein n=1 Tax=Natrialba magadii TaxID=13769 RepID=UPI00135F1A5B|nr:hypothetical protein [Natrialba magadii]
MGKSRLPSYAPSLDDADRLGLVLLRTADCGLRTADCGLRTADCGLRTADCGLRTADCGLRTADNPQTACRIRPT